MIRCKHCNLEIELLPHNLWIHKNEWFSCANALANDNIDNDPNSPEAEPCTRQYILKAIKHVISKEVPNS